MAKIENCDADINSNRVLELLSNEDTKIKDITDFFYRESIKKFNQCAVYEFAHYDNPTYSYIPFPEQRIVLQTLYKLNDNKTSLKKTILTDEILLDIKHKLNDSKQCSTLYNKPKTLELIGKIFYLEFKNNKTRIDSIKL